MKIGLLGGSFNPAHRGHRRLSRHAIARLGLDEVWWLVSPGNPLKSGARDMAPLATRLRSARAMARGLPISATAIEVALGTRFTVDTVRALIARHPCHRFVWLIGGDIVEELHRWRDWRGLARQLPLAIATRPGHDGLSAQAPPAGWLRRFVRPSNGARRWPDWPLPAVVRLPMPPDPTTATAIRHTRPDWAARFGDKAVYDPIARTHIGAATDPTQESHLPTTDIASQAPIATDAPPLASDSLHRLILDQLDEDQAVDLVTIPLAGKSSIADHMIVASGRSTRQVASMATKLAERVKKATGLHVPIEGLPHADWVLIDAGDVIVHLFRPEVREFYNLERMWSFGEAGDAAA